MTKACLECEKPITRDAIRCLSCSARLRGLGMKGVKKPARTKEHILKLMKANTGRKHTKEHRENIRNAHRIRSENGLGNMPVRSNSYVAVHLWLKSRHGKASKCEFCNTKKTYRYEWALKKGYSYEKNRENFLQLCVKCHRDYDGNNGWQTQAKMKNATLESDMRRSG